RAPGDRCRAGRLKAEPRLRSPFSLGCPSMNGGLATVLTMGVLLTSACGGGGEQAAWERQHTADEVFNAANQSRSSLSSEDIVARPTAGGATTAELAFAGPGALR